VSLNGRTLPLLAHSLLPWRETFALTTVVVKPGSQSLRSTVEAALGRDRSHAIRWIECNDAAEGMSASLRRGVSVCGDAAGWVVGLADMPLVPPAAIAGVFRALRQGASIAAPSCDDRRGHPVGFSREYRNDLQQLRGDVGARKILEQAGSKISYIKIDDSGVLADIDTPADLHAL
ncbi:MAG: nucleotidyltransferase family protein, partial [Gallionella sp.]